jgi:hypothetical protein
MNFFIVGVGRSGTSLLQSILSSHSKICIPPETGFVRKNIFSFQRIKAFNKEGILSENENLKRLNKNMSEIASWKTFKNEIDFYTIIVENYRLQQNKEIAGDKDPRLIEFIPALKQCFPETKIIHLVRDPRDVLLSKKKAQWSKSKPSWYHIFANYIQLRIGERAGKKILEEKYCVITYENLLANPEKVLLEICSYLGVEFEDSMLSFQNKAKELVSEEEKQWKKETMGPLLKNNTGKWKGKLKTWEVALTEKLCDEAFQIGKYVKSDAFSGLVFKEKVKVLGLYTILKLVGIAYMSFRIWSQKVLVLWKY